MKKNIGPIDQITRLGISVILIIVYYKEILPTSLRLGALIVALLLTITSLVSICPLYTLFGINTFQKKTKK